MSNHIFLSEPDCIRIIQTNRVKCSMWRLTLFGFAMFAVLTAVILERVA